MQRIGRSEGAPRVDWEAGEVLCGVKAEWKREPGYEEDTCMGVQEECMA